MTNTSDSLSVTQVGDIVLLVSPTNKKIIARLNPGEQIHTHRGVLFHDQLIGIPWGSEITTHTGSTYILIKPTLNDLLLETRRSTQIMYPKDIGYVLLKLGIGENQVVIEAGSGSGALTSALAWYIGDHGKIYSYDINENAQNLARKNLARLGLEKRVIFKNKDISEGFDETNVDALFLDVPNPQDYMAQVSQALKPGGNFGAILPTTNQVSRLLNEFYPFHFGFVEVCEILMRYYKPVAERLRPTDRMVAHTGYLVFARPFKTQEVIQNYKDDN
ncbi:MAG: tRNA (adenine-N1)-methyltransferase [Anaerolineales bacterium]